MIPERIQSRALLGFAPLVSECGGDARQLLAKQGIPAQALEEDALPLALDALAALYEDAAIALGLADFGLRLAQKQDLSLYGPLALVIQHARTVADALDKLQRYFSFHTSGAQIHITTLNDRLQVEYRLLLGEGVPSRQITEQSFAMACTLWSVLAPAAAGRQIVLLRHQAQMPLAVYQNVLGCEVRFNQSTDAILLPSDALALPVDQADPGLALATEACVARVLRRFPLNVGRQTEDLIRQQLALGGAGIDQIAAQLGLQRRTLQRRLAQQGLEFGGLVDDVRRELATALLAQSEMTLAQVSSCLGYNEQSSFHRACRRWFAMTPQNYRQTLMVMSS
ncbi:MAG: hypothetical protein CMI03_17780 [Oceanospirillaceae bacterium]|uniref:AraC family transcriptional regulator n=1 Tax=unclassified Thalassolituus TaxID=2624967 RepID=UPI000C5C11BC|nr:MULTISPECIES: AraC family transcriptional regulator [unclassified Thalassolituus]MAS26103.1 hypothetical protein [Oceanospirillaceae bacterium]MBS54593.1 hypothetical protein [Oceanospirillaceae bacterium]